MDINLTSENAAAVTAYAKILGCSESEFLNRYLELHLDNPKDEIMTVWDTIGCLVISRSRVARKPKSSGLVLCYGKSRSAGTR